jgi:hypothetical protein
MGSSDHKRHVVTSAGFDFPPPTVRRAAEQTRWDWFFIRVLRPAWGYRVEFMLLVALVAGHHVLADALGEPAGLVVLIGVLAAALAWLPTRLWILMLLHGSGLRRDWLKGMRHALLTTYNDRVPRPVEITAVPCGDRMRVRIPAGLTVSALSEQSEVIATCLAVREIRVSRDKANAQFAEVTVVRRDPLSGKKALPWPNADASSLSMWEPIPVGIDENGERVPLALAERNVLLGGEPGSGKSVALSMLVATAGLDPTVELYLFDGAVVELAPWRACATRCVGPSLDEAISVLKEIQTEVEDRCLTLLANGARKVTRGDGIPLIVVVIDELAYYLNAERKASAEIGNLLRDITSRGRKAGIIVLAATQKPSHEIIPTALRDLFSFRWAMRCSTPDASDTILGRGCASKGFSADDIDAADRGVGWLRHEGVDPVRLKAYYLSDEDLSALAKRAREVREAYKQAQRPPLHLINEEDPAEGAER